MTKTELKDIIKECLLEMSCNTFDSNAELAISEGCSFSDINDEISLFEANVSYILSANEACILQESSVGDTVKAILDKVAKAIKFVIKKIGEFISFVVKKIKGLKDKFSIKTKQLIARAKEIKAKKGKINEEKLKAKHTLIGKNNEMVEKTIEDFKEYADKRMKAVVKVKPSNKAGEELNLYTLKFDNSYNEKLSEFCTYAKGQLSTLQEFLDSDDDNKVDGYDIEERTKFVDLSDIIYKSSNPINLENDKIETDIDVYISKITEKYKEYQNQIDLIEKNIKSLESMKKSFEDLSDKIDKKKTELEKIIKYINTDTFNGKTEDERGETAYKYRIISRKYITLSTECSAIIKACNDYMEHESKRLSLYNTVYNLYLRNVEIVMSCAKFKPE